MMAKWTIEEGRYSARLVVQGPWTSAILQKIRNEWIREIELNYAKGWAGGDYSFLSQLSDLEVLEITDWNASDLSAVNTLEALRRLKLFTYCKTEIRFSQFPLLEECSLEWWPKARSLFEHAGVQKLFINKYPGKDLIAFEKMSNLRSLSLASPKIETLRGVTALKKLTFLGVYVARRLTTLVGLEELRDIVQLEVSDCPKIKDIVPLADLHKLEELHLCNDGEIDTLKPISEHKDLRVLLFYESTNIHDGDLSVLKGLPRLEHVVFMDRPHYSHRLSDFPQRPPCPTNSCS